MVGSRLMGTRHLTVVQLDGIYRIAQYGQWDGYPEGQGITILHFLRDYMDRPHFLSKLRALTWIDRPTLQNRWVSCGADIRSPMVDMATSEAFADRYPHLHRNTGAKVLYLVHDSDGPLQLDDGIGFAQDSLFCEWAYVIDFDLDLLQVYKGFNKTPLFPGERFYTDDPDFLDARSEGYEPVRILTHFFLSDLPADDAFISAIDEAVHDEPD